MFRLESGCFDLKSTAGFMEKGHKIPSSVATLWSQQLSALGPPQKCVSWLTWGPRVCGSLKAWHVMSFLILPNRCKVNFLPPNTSGFRFPLGGNV